MTLRSFYSLNWKILIVLSAVYIQSVTSIWEYAICTKQNIIFYDSQWNEVADAASSKLGALKALTYDTTHDIFYFTDSHDAFMNINSLKLKRDGTIKISTILQINERNLNIEDIVYDFNDDILFYSDRDNERIMQINFDRSSENVTGVQKVFISTNGKPSGLELDACRRNLYFTVTTHEPNLNVISIMDKDARIVCKEEHHQPVAIALDHLTDRIYISDKAGSTYYIKSFTKAGGDLRNDLISSYRTPRSLAVDHENIYYLDGSKNELRKFSKHGPMRNSSEFFMKFKSDPMDVVVRSSFVDAVKVDLSSCNITEGRLKELRSSIERIRADDRLSCIATAPSKINCLHGGTYDEDSSRCVCKDRRYDGDSCEIDLCYNFCLNGGECSMREDLMTSRLIPECSCTNGFTGDRCEVDVCSSYCLNSGRCVSVKQKATCECPKNYFGKRCENEHQILVTQPVDVQMVASSEYATSTTTIRTTTTDEEEVTHESNEISNNPQIKKCPVHLNLTYIILAICLMLSLLFFLLILLVIRRFHKPMRPRIRKKFVVHKNIEPMTYRPTTEQCEVIIEDCCNMNICETPCFDPKILQQEINENNIKVKLTTSKKCGSSKDDKQDLLKNMEINQ